MAASLEQFVQHQLQSGKDQSYDELLQASLKLLQKHEEELDRVAEALRPAAAGAVDGEDCPAGGREPTHAVPLVCREGLPGA
jgi:Arc/MetJ-type ribon-helix-helix transcriptional regulator